MMPKGEIRQIFAETVLREHDHDYSIVMIDLSEKETAKNVFKNLQPFSSITFTREEVSVVLKTNDWNIFKDNFSEYRQQEPYRLITFDIVLDLSLVGFFSVVSSVLAERNISIYCISTYLKDHILVKKTDVSKAIEVLKEIIIQCKSTN
jgi:hypothetical protein